MSYKTTDELNHFDFEDACISEMRMGTGTFSLLADNVKILPDNSCNRDIRTMRTNQLCLKISDAVIDAFVEEGYKVYDANGRLIREENDHLIEASDYARFLANWKDAASMQLSKTTAVMKFPSVQRTTHFSSQ